MKIVDFGILEKKLIGCKIPKPLSGTLSGHAAGEPFDKLVYSEIKKMYPKNTFRQYEYLNDLYIKFPKVISLEDRELLFNSPTVMFLLSRGKNATEKWDQDNLFEEKQNDTADIIVVKDKFYELIDIKTRNLTKRAQAPNIISSYKLAQTCANMIDNNDYNSFSLNYFGIDWEMENNYLVCKNTYSKTLFKTNPSKLYINWAAAMQLQFHVEELDQSFIGDNEKWTREYLKFYVKNAKQRTKKMLDTFVKPFIKYI